MPSVKAIIVIFILGFCNLLANQNNFNPYEVLGLSRTASDAEIRQAYKKLAKHWHPDKNSAPNAHDQFTKINAAYEILSDSEKRKNYDTFGTTSENTRQDFNTYHFRDPFDLFQQHFFHGSSQQQAKKRIYFHEFRDDILPNSDKKPYLIFVNARFCWHCRRALELFRFMEYQLNDVGVGTGEFNIEDEALSSQLGTIDAPSLCVISQRRVYHYNKNELSETNIKNFVRKSIPIEKYIPQIKNYESISTWLKSYSQSNRPSALLITKQQNPTLKFVIPCLHYSTRIQCAWFHSSVIKIGQVPSYLKHISLASDILLLFKEDINKPELIIKDNEFTFNNIKSMFESNQFLHVPTISSADVLNYVCPATSAMPCFLIIGDFKLFDQYRLTFAQLSKHLDREHNVRIAYLDSSSAQQQHFHRLVSYYHKANEKKIAILMARRWFHEKIEIQNLNINLDEKSLNEFQRNIAHILEKLKLSINSHWQHSTKHELPIIINFDERNQGSFAKVINEFENWWNYWSQRNRLIRNLFRFLFTYQFWIIIVLIVTYVYFSNEQTNNRNKSAKTANKTTDPLKILVFNESLIQKYTQPNAPNVILLLLIADTSEDSYVKQFKQEIRSINNSHMIFSILYRHKSSEWLDELSNNIQDNQHKQSIRFLPATVLALYIRRKFFVSYSLTHNNQYEPSILKLSDWIDLLFNGTLRQPITVTHWPMRDH